MHFKIELLDVNQQSVSVSDSRISELRKDIQKYVNGKNLLEAKLEEATREPSMEHPIIFLLS